MKGYIPNIELAVQQVFRLAQSEFSAFDIKMMPQ